MAIHGGSRKRGIVYIVFGFVGNQNNPQYSRCVGNQNNPQYSRCVVTQNKGYTLMNDIEQILHEAHIKCMYAR